MGKRYHIRVKETIVTPLKTEEVNDYYVNNWWELLRLMIKFRRKIIFIRRWF